MFIMKYFLTIVSVRILLMASNKRPTQHGVSVKRLSNKSSGEAVPGPVNAAPSYVIKSLVLSIFDLPG